MKAILLFLIVSSIGFANAQMPKILPLKEQAQVIDRLLEEKIKTVLPALMRQNNNDMWIVMAREYNEDPVIRTMLPAIWHAARRRTVLAMYDPGDDASVETLAVARYDVGTVFKKSWEKEKQPNQWARLVEIIEEKNPKKIGLNYSSYEAQADGLTYAEHQSFLAALPKKYHDRIVSAEKLAINWLEVKTQSEMVIYPQIVNMAHNILAEGLSEVAIQPGVTSTEDLVWW